MLTNIQDFLLRGPTTEKDRFLQIPLFWLNLVLLQVTGYPEIEFFVGRIVNIFARIFCYATCILRPPDLW